MAMSSGAFQVHDYLDLRIKATNPECGEVVPRTKPQPVDARLQHGSVREQVHDAAVRVGYAARQVGPNILPGPPPQHDGDPLRRPAVGRIKDVSSDRTHGDTFCSRRRVIFFWSPPAIPSSGSG